MEIMKWKKISKEYCFQSKWFDISKNQVKLPNGFEIEDYYVVENQDSVMVAATDEDNNLIMKKEYRLPVDEVLLELPAGAIEIEDDDCLYAAKRELLEETGYSSDDWVYMGETYDCPERCTSKLYLFWARNAIQIKNQSLDNTEDISLFIINIRDALKLIEKSEIKVNSCVHAIYRVALKMNVDCGDRGNNGEFTSKKL